MFYALIPGVALVIGLFGLVLATDAAAWGVMGTIVTGLFTMFGLIIKYLIDQIAKKDAELSEARMASTHALTESSIALQKAIERETKLSSPTQATT